MAKEKYFPFRSVSGDRKYSAEDWAAYFAQFIGNGVFYSSADKLKVAEYDGMKIKVQKGAGFIAGRMYLLEEDTTITLDTADGVLNRIDRIVLRCDYDNRLMTVTVKKGSYSVEPTAPDLTRDTGVYELALADIYVATGAVTITAANITDQRFNTSLCGIVTGLIEQADTEEIFSQFQAAFEEWFEYVKEVLSEDAAGNLLALINTKANNSDLQAEVAARKAEVAVERARIDALTKMEPGSTMGDAELQDIRIGADGVTYETAGAAVRAQVTNVKSDLGELKLTEFTFTEGQYVNTTGVIATHGDYAITDYIPINSALKIKYSDIFASTGAGVIYQFDADKEPLKLLLAGAGTTTLLDGELEVYGDGYIVVSKHRNAEPKLEVTYNDILSNKAEILNMKSKTENLSFTLTSGYVNAEGVQEHSDYLHTELVDISKYTYVVFPMYFSSGARAIVYDSNKNFIEEISNSGSLGTVYTYNASNCKAKYICISVRTAHSDSFYINGTTDFEQIKNTKNAVVELIGKTGTVDSENPLAMLNSDVSFIRCFNRIVCIGDSLTQGVFNYTTEGNGNDYVDTNYSYPSVLAKLTGCEVANYGQGGTTAQKGERSWETFADSEAWLDEANKGDAYIIALGTNDITALNSFTGNVDTDVNLSDYTQNANTSVGGYSRIASRILEVQPKAKLFFITISNVRNDEVTRTEANEKIRALAEKFGAYVIDLQAYAETTTAEQTYFASYYKNGSHNNALGYNLRARQYATYIDWIIKNNIADFQDIQFIGTDKAY